MTVYDHLVEAIGLEPAITACRILGQPTQWVAKARTFACFDAGMSVAQTIESTGIPARTVYDHFAAYRKVLRDHA